MGQKIGSMAVGSTVKIKEDGVSQDYLIVHQGKPSTLYDESCNGTWLLRKNILEMDYWGMSNKYITSNIRSFQLYYHYEEFIKSIIKIVKIPYWDVNEVISGSNGDQCRLFLLSCAEVGLSGDYVPEDGSKLDYFLAGDNYNANLKRIATYSGSKSVWWTRSPVSLGNTDSWRIDNYGVCEEYESRNAIGIRPAFIVPSNLIVDDSGNLTDKTIAIPTLSAPVTCMTGESISLSWTSAEGATGYILERNIGSSWEQIYDGSDLSYSDIAQSGWTTVQYRIKAYNSTDTSEYDTSDPIKIIPSDILVISGEDSDLGILDHHITYNVTTNTGNPITLSRTVNGRNIGEISVMSGFEYMIPAFDLPSGTGIIVITAKVTSSEFGEITKTRTWSYTKHGINLYEKRAGPAVFKTSGGRALYPLTLAETVRTTTSLGGTLDQTLELLYPHLNTTIIDVGSYTGTGEYGSDKKCSITLSKTPIMVTIYGQNKTLVINSTDTSGNAYINGNKVEWYSDISAEDQLNTLNESYTYIALYAE